MPGIPSGKGCDACRKQKKKCDQAKPACTRCSRLNIECVGAGQQRYRFKGYAVEAAEPKVRPGGCLRCKAARVRCSEVQPDCGRCGRLKLACQYSTPRSLKVCRRLPSAIAHQPHQHHHHLAPSLLVQPTYCNLGPKQVHYFDRFRNQVVYQLGSHSFDDFWLRTVLRESTRDNCVLEIILGIGALSQALESAPRDIPLYRAPFSSHPSSSSYAEAIRYYGSSLAKLRRRLSSSQLEGSTRTLLISSILFSAFELLQGNSVSADQLIANSVFTLKDTIMHSAWPDRKSQIAAAYDDEGVEDAEFILMRRLSFKSLLAPLSPAARDSLLICILPYAKGPSPPDQKHDFKVFWKLWMRFLTLALIWYVRAELRAMTDHPVYDGPRPQQEQRSLLAQIKAWEIAAQLKLDEEDDPYGRKVLKQIVPGLKTLYFCIYTIFDDTTEPGGEACKLAREIMGLAESILEETPLFQAGLGEVYEGIQSISIGLSRRCQDREVRSRAMSICKRVVNARSRWDAKAILMGTCALVALEEAARDETGAIPLATRYDWIHSSWSDDYTELSATFRAKVAKDRAHHEEKYLTLRPKDFGLA